MTRSNTILALCSLLLTAPLAALSDEPIIPSSPHRVLFVDDEIDSYYLIEPDKPLSAFVEGPGLIEMRLRRVIWVSDPPVQPTSLHVALDDHVQPPLTFRRAREEKVRFVDEPRFVPSVVRTARLAVPSGSAELKLRLGSDTQGVAVALRFRPAPEVADTSRGSRLPPLAALPPSSAAAPTDPAPPPSPSAATTVAATAKVLPPAEPSTAPDEPMAPPPTAPAAEPTTGPSTVASGDDGATAPALTASPGGRDRPLHLELGLSQLGTDPLAEIEMSLDLSSTFINLGRSAPGLSVGLRYPLPWLERQLSLGVRFSASRYAFVGTESGRQVLDAEVWVFPIKLSLAYRIELYRDLHTELGAGVGVAVHNTSLRYQQRQHGVMGVGASADAHAELGWRLPWGVAFARWQLDAIGAGNTIVNNFDYLGASLGLGYRVTL